MKHCKLVAPCHFGMEAVLKREIHDLGYEVLEVDNGRVTYEGDAEGIVRSNIFLRATERVLLLVDQFKATTFEELFQGILAIAWEEYLPLDAKFWVTKATSINSKLFSPSDIQRIVKKAMVESMKKVYAVSRFEETGASYPVRIQIHKDLVSVYLDTTGVSLHKRGYRKYTVKAPVTETLAAGILLLSPWKKDRLLVDPFCGSGTFLIEAALIARNIAPGRNRRFTAEEWVNLIDPREWKEIRLEARDLETPYEGGLLQGYDIDGEALKAARQNAELAGVSGDIHFQQRDILDFHTPKKYGFVISNPPYGERLSDKETMKALYTSMGQIMRENPTWSFYWLTGFEDAVAALGKKPTKNRKIYNGMMKTYLYQYMGEKPPGRSCSKEEKS